MTTPNEPAASTPDPTPPPTPPAQPPATPANNPPPAGAGDDLLAAINALPERLANTFREIQAPAPTPTPNPDASDDKPDDKPAKPKKAEKVTDPEPEPPKSRTFADVWFGN